jgi:hypothetical protein
VRRISPWSWYFVVLLSLLLAAEAADQEDKLTPEQRQEVQT